MIVSRAVFLKICGAVCVSTALPRWTSRDSPLLSSAARTSGDAARFHPLIGSIFVIMDSGHNAGQRLRLAEVSETTVSPSIEQYALNFSSDGSASLSHGLYTLRHASLGDVDMFITPVGAPAGDPVYQACFSRLIPAETHPCRISS